MTDDGSVQQLVGDLMPEVMADLGALVSHPSVAFPGFPREPVMDMAKATVELFRRYGVADVRTIDVEDGYPLIYGEVAGPPGAPTVVLYAHYDVQPAPADQGWDTDPWTATTKDDGRVYGRGAADDKSGIMIHAATVRCFDGAPPVGIRIVIEGEEETISHLDSFVTDHPKMFDCDAFVISDMGNPSVGQPALTTALRGDVSCTVTVETLEHPVHSGLFGGAAPDALVALIRILATLHDADGSTTVEGVEGSVWSGADVDEAAYRDSSSVLEGVDLIGSGSLGSRLWSKPSATVIGIDAPSVDEAANILIPHARAKISLRIPPGSDADKELDRLIEHLRSAAPWNVKVDVRQIKAGWPFQVDPQGKVVTAARRALERAYGKPATDIGSGGSIPLVAVLQEASPRAEVILWGAEDLARSRIHASNESVDPNEIAANIVAQVLLLEELGAS
ncbi:MAG: cysteinylglycine-S-conjugate dipeptidase [Actinomycetota bacterium]|nr:cysteinylglycine-S-conjugate dipeptidase [Actinomycetota bacterium]